MDEKHRRARIVDALYELFEPLREDSECPYDEMDTPDAERKFPIRVKTVQKRYPNWTALENQKALPALTLNFWGISQTRWRCEHGVRCFRRDGRNTADNA